MFLKCLLTSEKIQNRKLRNIIAKLRLSSHQLNIETGRHRNIERNNRKCIVCPKDELEDEYHFVLICPAYSNLRTKYVKPYYYKRPNMYKFVQLLNSDNTTTLKHLAVYCKNAFKLRHDTLMTISKYSGLYITYIQNIYIYTKHFLISAKFLS